MHAYTYGMYTGIYQSSSAMSGLEKWQDAVSQNIASTNVSGYKKIDTVFNSEGVANMSTEDFATELEVQLVGTKNKTAFTQGMLTQTGDPMNVAIDGNGFFQVQQADGTTLFTRNSNFKIDNNYRLVNFSGNTVLDEAGREITFGNNKGDIDISQDGLITVDGVEVARIGVYNVPDTSQLLRAEGGFIASPDMDVGAVALENPRVLQGYAEQSNVNPITEMVSLIQVNRAYEANTKVISTLDQIMGRVNQNLAV